MNKTLIEQINEFGLNPKDWQFCQIGRRRGKIILKSDSNIQMSGAIVRRKGHSRWAYLELNARI